MSGYGDDVKDVMKTRLQTSASENQATQVTLDSLEEEAGDIADAVANPRHLGFVGQIKTVTEKTDELIEALSVFMSGVSSWVVSPGDGGAVLKGLISGPAVDVNSAITQLSAANEELKSKVDDYV